MKPHIEEAERFLRLADRDIVAFDVLKNSPGVHPVTVHFHAQQAVEKSLKAALFACQVEFRRTHDLEELSGLLSERGVHIPLSAADLNKLNPFAVEFRYDDRIASALTYDEAERIIKAVRTWIGTLIEAAS